MPSKGPSDSAFGSMVKFATISSRTHADLVIRPATAIDYTIEGECFLTRLKDEKPRKASPLNLRDKVMTVSDQRYPLFYF